MLFDRYILSIENSADQEKYLSEMLDPSNSSHAAFIREFGQRQRQGTKETPTPKGIKVYRKADEKEEYIAGGKNKKKPGQEVLGR